jgi:tetratricopeptide (TPR) repeat protein
MTEMQELIDLDVSDSMKSNIEALCKVIENIDVQNKEMALEQLNQVHTKILEIEEYFWRPVDSEDVYQRLISITKELGDEEKSSHYNYQIKVKEANDLEFKGRVQDFFGNKEKAVEYYEKALKLVPTHELALPAHRKAVKSMEKAQAEIPKLAMKLEKDNQNEKFWFKMGLAHLNLGVVDKAIEYFDKVIALNPTDPDAHARRGTAMESLGDYEDAKRYLERALELKPTSMIAKRGMNYAIYFLEQ